MKVELGKIAHARSGDKGLNSNVGLIFHSKEVYEWATKHITVELVKEHFQSIVKIHDFWLVLTRKWRPVTFELM